LDNDYILSHFAALEKKVEQFIEVCESHETTNLNLKNKSTSGEEELQGRIAAEKKFAKEKALIRSKIDNLLVKLDEIAEA
jgi:hypothetical protein